MLGFQSKRSSGGEGAKHKHFRFVLRSLAESDENVKAESIEVWVQWLLRKLNVPAGENDVKKFRRHLREIGKLKEQCEEKIQGMLTAADALITHIEHTKINPNNHGIQKTNLMWQQIENEESKIMGDLDREKELYENFKKAGNALLEGIENYCRTMT